MCFHGPHLRLLSKWQMLRPTPPNNHFSLSSSVLYCFPWALPLRQQRLCGLEPHSTATIYLFLRGISASPVSFYASGYHHMVLRPHLCDDKNGETMASEKTRCEKTLKMETWREPGFKSSPDTSTNLRHCRPTGCKMKNPFENGH